MKINLIGMILEKAGRRQFEGLVIGDDGKEMSAADSLHSLIMEYARVASGGQSTLVVASRLVTVPVVDDVDQEGPCCLPNAVGPCGANCAADAGCMAMDASSHDWRVQLESPQGKAVSMRLHRAGSKLTRPEVDAWSVDLVRLQPEKYARVVRFSALMDAPALANPVAAGHASRGGD